MMDNIKKIALSSTNRFDLWSGIVKEVENCCMVEIGVWKGDFAMKMLENCENIKEYTMVDPWANQENWDKPFNNITYFDKIYEQAMQKTYFAAEKIKVLRGCTNDVIDYIEDASIDIAYIDGDHTLRGITNDLIKLFPKIKEGGYIGGDDFIENPWQHGKAYEPTLVYPYAVYFSEAMDLPISALPHNQFILYKKSSEKFEFKGWNNRYNNLSLKNSLIIKQKSPMKVLREKIAQYLR